MIGDFIPGAADAEERQALEDLRDRVSRKEVDDDKARETLRLIEEQRSDNAANKVIGKA